MGIQQGKGGWLSTFQGGILEAVSPEKRECAVLLSTGKLLPYILQLSTLGSLQLASTGQKQQIGLHDPLDKWTYPKQGHVRDFAVP